MRIKVDPEPRYLGYGKSVCLIIRVKAKALANSDLTMLHIIREYVSEPGTGLVKQLL